MSFLVKVCCLRNVVFCKKIVQRLGQKIVNFLTVIARVGLQLRQRTANGTREMCANQHGRFCIGSLAFPYLGRLFFLGGSGKPFKLRRALF